MLPICFGNQAAVASAIDIRVRYDKNETSFVETSLHPLLTNTTPGCLRCTHVALMLPEGSPEISFCECPECGRHCAQKRGGALTFRWLHPICLLLYNFNSGSVSDPDFALRVVENLTHQRSAEEIELIVHEDEWELEQPSQPLREILDNDAMEADCRAMLPAVVALLKVRSKIVAEGAWLAALDPHERSVFMVRLADELTIAGRNGNGTGTDQLGNPSQLRRINEIRHCVTASLRQVLAREDSASFQQSIADSVLQQADANLRERMWSAWGRAK